MKVTIFPLGAGQEVGRSCIFLSFGGEKNVLLDVGVHMGYNDKRKYPNFDHLLKVFGKESLNDLLDVVLVSHFHLDHCAALPILTEEKGYNGPILTSEPSKAIIPLMLRDYMNVTKDGLYQFTKQKIESCCQKLQTIALKETKEINGIKITPYYAGHVLGAVMFLVEYKGVKVVYTGDYNTVADRHLSACQIDKVNPDILISESTYGTAVRDWKKNRELQFMQQIKETFDQGGKVLIPVFALGRAQEFFVLIEDIWKKTGWTYPVYFSSSLSSKVHFFYKFFVNWMNYNINYQIEKEAKNPFDLEYIKKYEKVYAKLEQPMLVLATPGMLHGGTSMEIFKEWCSDPKNKIIIPGYCIKGTLGNMVLGGAKKINIEGKIHEVNMKVCKMSFSAHADNRGIISLVEHLNPKKIIFVHGEKKRMEDLGVFIQKNLNIDTFCPKNFEILDIDIEQKTQIYQYCGTDDSEKYQIFSQTPSSKISVEETDNEKREQFFYENNKMNDDYLVTKNILAKCEGKKIFKIEECDGNQIYLIKDNMRSSF